MSLRRRRQAKRGREWPGHSDLTDDREGAGGSQRRHRER